MNHFSGHSCPVSPFEGVYFVFIFVYFCIFVWEKCFSGPWNYLLQYLEWPGVLARWRVEWQQNLLALSSLSQIIVESRLTTVKWNQGVCWNLPHCGCPVKTWRLLKNRAIQRICWQIQTQSMMSMTMQWRLQRLTQLKEKTLAPHRPPRPSLQLVRRARGTRRDGGIRPDLTTGYSGSELKLWRAEGAGQAD